MPENYQLPSPKRVKKKGYSAAFWIGIALACIAALTLLLSGIYFGYILPNRLWFWDEDTDPKVTEDPEIIVTSTPTPTRGPVIIVTKPSIITTTTQAPVTVKPPRPKGRCYERQKYEWIKDEVIPSSPEKEKYRISIFSGLVTHERMYSVCDRINRGSRKLEVNVSYGALYFNKEFDEARADKIIRDNQKTIFKDLEANERLLWTGVVYQWKDNEWKVNYQTKPEIYNSFCNRSTYESTLAKLKADQKENIYVVKDYRHGRIERKHACWQLYTSTQLVDIMGQPVGTFARLPFVCSSRNDTGTSGREAMPGNFSHRYPSSDGNFIIYGVSATREEARKECKAHGGNLVIVNHYQKLEILEDYLKNSSHRLRSDDDMVWTAGYLNMIPDSKGSTDWIKYDGCENITRNSNEIFSTHFTTDKSAKEKFELAKKDLIENRKRSKRDENYSDCNGLNRHNSELYVGIENNQKGRKGLAILNINGHLDMDRVRANVFCEPDWLKPCQDAGSTLYT